MKTLLLALLLLVPVAVAEPVAQIRVNGVRIVLHSDPCTTAHIKNLPRRVEWIGQDKTFIGCWSLNPFGLVVMYFDDLTAEAIPVSRFSEVKEI